MNTYSSDHTVILPYEDLENKYLSPLCSMNTTKPLFNTNVQYEHVQNQDLSYQFPFDDDDDDDD